MLAADHNPPFRGALDCDLAQVLNKIFVVVNNMLQIWASLGSSSAWGSMGVKRGL